MPWDEFSDLYVASPDVDARDRLIAAAVRAPADIFEIERLNAPLAGLRFDSIEALNAHVRQHVQADIDRRTNAAFSADLGAFNALLQSFASIGRVTATGRISSRSRVQDVAGWWFSFFMYFASGPPPARLRQLLALEAAGLVTFVGAGMTVRADARHGKFVATSTSHPDEVHAEVLIDAVIAGATVARAADQMLQRLRDRGEIQEEIVTDESGWTANTGKVLVAGPGLNLVRADGSTDRRRHAIGSFTSRPAAGAFSRPNTNAPTFRQNDAVARSVLTTLAGQPAGEGST